MDHMIGNAGQARPMSLRELNHRLSERQDRQCLSSLPLWKRLQTRPLGSHLRQSPSTRLTRPLVCLGAHLFSGLAGTACLALLAWALPQILSAPGFQNHLIALLALLAMAFLTVFCGTRLRALGNIQHECAHRSFVDKTGVNDAVGLCIGVLLLQPFCRYRQAHFTHHRFLGDGARDRDLSRYTAGLVHTASAATLRKQLALAAAPHHFRVGLRVTVLDNLDPAWCNFLRAALIFLLGTAAVTALVSGSALTLFVCSLPFVLIYPFLCVWSDIADHAVGHRQWNEPKGLRSAVFCLTRNHLFRCRILNALFFPRNDGYHLIHHLYPSLPVTAYPSAHEVLLENDSAYRGMEHTLFLV